MELYNVLTEISKELPNESKITPVTKILTSVNWMSSIFGFSDREILSSAKSNLDRAKIIRNILEQSAIYNPNINMCASTHIGVGIL